jgi:hypothetical protein
VLQFLVGAQSSAISAKCKTLCKVAVIDEQNMRLLMESYPTWTAEMKQIA